MKIHILTIFPESFLSYFSSSILWNAKEKWLFITELYKLNDFSKDNYKRVDDKAYWMHWQVLSPEPLSKAINFIFHEWNVIGSCQPKKLSRQSKEKRMETIY